MRRPDNKPASRFTIEAYIEAALRAWGGPEEFAAELKRRYDAPQTNAHAKVRILDMMMNFLKMQHDLLPKEATINEMTDAELEAELHAILAGEGADPDEDEDE